MAVTGIGTYASYTNSYGNTQNAGNKTGRTYKNAHEYKNYLTQKYDCLRSRDYSVNINSSLLSKAMGDEKTKQWLEYNLSLIPKTIEQSRAYVAAVVENNTGIEIEPLFEEQVDFDTFSKSDFRVVKVKNCEAVPKSKKLLRFTLDDGTENERTILSGVHAFYEPEELVGKTLLAIVNLPPRSMMGIVSCGMLLSAIHNVNGEEKLNLVMLDDSIPAGAKLY